MGNIKSKLKEMLKASAEAEKAKALLTLELLGDNAVGIGDHSTGDFYKKTILICKRIANDIHL